VGHDESYGFSSALAVLADIIERSQTLIGVLGGPARDEFLVFLDDLIAMLIEQVHKLSMSLNV
jgi:hypothetical protein